MKQVLLSIITVTRNPDAGILRTISGISRFLSDQVEYVLVDGGSERAILQQMKDLLPPEARFLSEPDEGIYDAMNKGWEMARGKYLLFLNDGDELLQIPLEELRNSEADVLLGSVQLDSGRLFAGRNSLLLRFRNLWPHQGTFYKRELAFRYQSQLKIFADFDLNQRLQKSQRPIACLSENAPLARHRSGGISGNRKGLKEFYSIIRSNYGFWSVAIAFLWFKLEGITNRFHLKKWVS